MYLLNVCVCIFTHTYILVYTLGVCAYPLPPIHDKMPCFLLYEMMLIKDGSLGNKDGNAKLILISYSFIYRSKNFKSLYNPLLSILCIFLTFFL